MTRLFNDPSQFAAEMVEGFAAAHGDHVIPVEGGVVSRSATPEGGVAVVIGGGSGHYPAFAGLVGPGIAAGAVMGDLFASPSAQQVQSVAHAAQAGGGVLLSYGNYAGDVLNFDAAQDRLREAGIECRTVVVTDDISSAPAAERERRRGIAGDLVVFKIAGAAAAEGRHLDAVAAVARRANDRTRSLGVAFSGCSLPGAAAPLFAVPAGRMAVGLGIHGEPGLREADVPTANDLARLLVEALLAEAPDDASEGGKVAVVLNGLGSVKYEELFVTYRSIARLLEDAKLEAVRPQVGEFCTSFDMAGVSLTLTWLDDDLERLWRAPADTPAFRVGMWSQHPDRIVTAASTAARAMPPASQGSRSAARRVARGLGEAASALDAHVVELGDLDAVAGDGDHGIGMQRGLRAAVRAARKAVSDGAGAGTTLIAAGEAWASRAGGTSGALWGAGLGAAGESIGDAGEPDADCVARAVDAGVLAVQAMGRAAPGDKTMVDALVPFAEELTARVDAGDPLEVAWRSAARRATEGAAATAEMIARLGRARTHGDRSIGVPDPGARSFALLMSTVVSQTDGLPHG